MKCRTCARRLDLEKLDYTVGCKHEQMEGFICLACAFEGVAYWMTNVNDEDSYCEEYVEKQVTGKLINVEIPTKREPDDAEKQVKGELISRRAVLDFVDSLEGLSSEHVGNSDTLEWILCSERLPEIDEEVLVYLFGDSPHLAWFDGDKWQTDYFTVDDDERPIAWMRLPKPWKGEKDD